MKTLTRRANITVAGCVVMEFILAEQTRLDRGASLGTRHVGHDPGLLAGLDVLDLEITLVGYDSGPSRDLGDHAALAKARSALAIRSNRCPNPAPSVPL